MNKFRVTWVQLLKPIEHQTSSSHRAHLEDLATVGARAEDGIKGAATVGQSLQPFKEARLVKRTCAFLVLAAAFG